MTHDRALETIQRESESVLDADGTTDYRAAVPETKMKDNF